MQMNSEFTPASDANGVLNPRQLNLPTPLPPPVPPIRPSASKPSPTDHTAPQVDLTATYNNRTGLGKDEKLQVIFNEAIQLAAGVIELHHAGDQRLQEAFSNGVGSLGGKVNIVDGALILETAAELAASSDDYLTFSSGVIQDLAGNNLSAISASQPLRFTTLAPDTEAPFLVDTRVSSEVINYLHLVFNEVVQLGSGNFEIRQASDQRLVERFVGGVEAGGDYPRISGTKVNIPLAASLKPRTDYYLIAAADALTDRAGNPLSATEKLPFSTGSQVQTSWLNTSVQEPQLSSISLQDPWVPDSNIQLYFAQSVKLGMGTISIHSLADNRNVETFKHGVGSSGGTITVSKGSNLIINPGVNLAFDTQYYLSFDDDAVTNKPGTQAFVAPEQLAALSFLGPRHDRDSPVLNQISAEVLQEGTLASTKVTLNFNEPVKLGEGTIELRNLADGSLIERFSQGLGSLDGYVQGASAGFDLHDGLVINGYSTLSLKTFRALSSAVKYYLTLAPNSIVDRFGNGFTGVAAAEKLQFTIPEPQSYVAPAPMPFSLLSEGVDNQIGVARWGEIYLNFNQGPQFGHGKLQLHNADDGSIVESFSDGVGSAGGSATIPQVLGGDMLVNTLVLKPGMTLAPATQYYITIDSGALLDAFGNAYAGIQDSQTLNFFTAGVDIVAPKLTTSNPSKQALGVALDETLHLGFDEPIQLASGKIELHQQQDDLLIERFTEGKGSTGGRVEVAGYGINIVPGQNLQPDMQYYLTVETNAVRDVAGNAFKGLTGSEVLKFRTLAVDKTAPALYWYEHSNLPVEQNLVVNSTEAVRLGSGSITLHSAQDKQVVETFAQGVGSNGGKIITTPKGAYPNAILIDPGKDLLPETKYYLSIDSEALTDLAGNKFPGIADAQTLSFSKFSPGPLFTQLYSSSYAPNSHWEISFDTAIKLGAGKIAIHSAADNSVLEEFYLGIGTAGGLAYAAGHTLVLAPQAQFANNSDYYITLDRGAVTNLAGDVYQGTADKNLIAFTTTLADTEPPRLNYANPEDNQTHVAANTDFLLYFNEPVRIGTEDIVLHNADGTVREMFCAGIGTDGGAVINAFVYGDNVLAIHPGRELQSGQSYYFTLEQGAIQDSVGNKFLGMSDRSSLNFQVASEANFATPAVHVEQPRDASLFSINAEMDPANVELSLLGVSGF